MIVQVGNTCATNVEVVVATEGTELMEERPTLLGTWAESQILVGHDALDEGRSTLPMAAEQLNVTRNIQQLVVELRFQFVARRGLNRGREPYAIGVWWHAERRWVIVNTSAQGAKLALRVNEGSLGGRIGKWRRKRTACYSSKLVWWVIGCVQYVRIYAYSPA